MTKQTPVPNAAMTTPAIAGPITREPLKSPALRATAFGRCARADHLVGQRLAAGRVEGEREPAERREQVDDRQRRRAGQRHDREHDRDEERHSLRRHDQATRVDAVGDDSGDEPEEREREEAPEHERADREGRARELEDEPCERDVLHPAARERDELPGEEDAVVAVAPEAAERARRERDRERPHAFSEQALESGDRGLDGLELGGLEALEALGEPRRPPCADAPHQLHAVVRQPQPDAPPVLARADALEQTRALEPVDVTGERRRRDPLLGRELGEREPGAPLDEPEQRRLPRGHSQLLGLLAELARQPQQNGPELGAPAPD